MPFPNFIGQKRFWTRERVIEGLKRAAASIDGPLPCRDRLYDGIKTGHLDWPTSHRVLEFFGSMARGWLAVGEPSARISLTNIDWSPEEEEYLIEYAGEKTLEDIATYLRRSYGGVKKRLNGHMGVRARDNQGFFSAAELAKEYRCPYQRVRTALKTGRIPGKFDRSRNRWQVDIRRLTPAAEGILRAPKMHSYKNSPTDLGDYYKRHGLRRTLVGGRLITVSVK